MQSLITKFYDQLIAFLKRHRSLLHDVFGSQSDFIFYGTYQRHFISEDSDAKQILRVQRILLKKEKKTVALLPHQLIPYCIPTLSLVVDLVSSDPDELSSCCDRYGVSLALARHLRKISKPTGSL